MNWVLFLFFPGDPSRYSWASLVFRAFLWVGIVVFSIPYLQIHWVELGFKPGPMHGVHLIFHEAGHMIFMMITNHQVTIALMGTGLQILFPLFVALAFYWINKDAFSTGLGLWWMGHATLDIAPYIGDARALNLPLITGGTGKEVGGHDWLFLLQHWNLLQQDHQIADATALAGKSLMLFALTWAALALIYACFVKANNRPEAYKDENAEPSSPGDSPA